MRKKRILFIGLGNVYGGAEVYLLRMIALLQNEADIYVCAAHPTFVERLSTRPVVRIRFPLIIGRLRGLRWILAILLVTFYVVRYRIDIVHVNGYSEILMLLPARLLFRRAIATRHIGFSNGVKRWCLDAESAANLIYRNCTFLAHAVVCVSDAVAKEARDVIPKARVVTIFNWVPFIPPFQCKPARRDGILHLLFVGRLEKRKGLALLLQALEMLNGIDLTVVGDGEDRPKLVEMAGQKPVRFVGYQADPRSFYEQTDVFVMPSLGPEGMPLVSLEAMSHGVPCILSDLDVHKEISENGRAALLFSKGDVLDLREKIRLLSREPAIRSRIAGSAYRLIQANYSPEAAKSAYMRVFGLIETNSASAQKGEDFYR